MLEKVKKIKITDKILFVILAFLLVLYILSFTKSCSSTDKREVVKTALVNKKYENAIDGFQLQHENEVLLLSKKDNLWFVDSSLNPAMTLPADINRIQKLTNDLINIQEMYKLSDNFKDNNAFGLTDSSAYTLRYYFSDKFNDIIFGNQDFALSSRYMMSGKSTAVYEIPNTFDKYLTTSVQSWTEPFIISQQILGPVKADDVQRTFVTFQDVTAQIDFDDKLLDLRHGGFPTAGTFSETMFNNPLMTIKLELGNRNIITILIAQSETSDEQEFNVSVNYFNSVSNTNYKSYSKISGWTYNKIKEIML